LIHSAGQWTGTCRAILPKRNMIAPGTMAAPIGRASQMSREARAKRNLLNARGEHREARTWRQESCPLDLIPRP
jgi:hypothetical protein